MASFDRYVSMNDWNLGEANKPVSLRGNLEPINVANLVPVHPSDLVKGKEYLLYNTTTHEKTKAKFIRAEPAHDEDEEGEMVVAHFDYIFQDKDGEITIESDENNINMDDDEDFVHGDNPFAEDVRFDTDRFGVYLPQTKQILGSKMFNTKKSNTGIPSELHKSIMDYTGGKKRKTNKRKTNKRKTIKRKTRRARRGKK